MPPAQHRYSTILLAFTAVFFRVAVVVEPCLAATEERDTVAPLQAGVARVEITDRAAGPVNDPCFAKALVLKNARTTVVLITLDAVAIGEIGRIGNEFLATVRGRLEKEIGVPPANVLINASHCHGIVRVDTAQLTVQAVKEAAMNLVPVKVGAGAGHEDRISENRRLKMKDGSEVDMRRAYSMPRDEDVASVGPIDPQIGLLRLDREDGRPLAVLYNFACHPIMNPPSKGNSADYPGFASKVIEESLGEGCDGVLRAGLRRRHQSGALQGSEPSRGCGAAGEHARPQRVACGAEDRNRSRTANSKLSNEVIALPRAADLERRIAAIQAEQTKLVASLKPTNINFKTFLPMLVQQKLSPDFPSHYSQSYLHDRSLSRKALSQLDADNRASVEAYLNNIQIMEQLTRLNTNLALLKTHRQRNQAAGKPTLDVEVAGLRIGDFKLVTFPGELTVQDRPQHQEGRQRSRTPLSPATRTATSTTRQRRSSATTRATPRRTAIASWHLNGKRSSKRRRWRF